VLAAAIAIAGCGGDDGNSTASSTATTTSAGSTTTTAGGGGGSTVGSGKGGVALEQLGSFDQPVYVTEADGDPQHLYVVEQCGRVARVPSNGGEGTTFLDLSDLVTCGGEQGLLSVAFAPDYADSGRLYVNYTDVDGDTRIVGYAMQGDHVSRASRRQVLFVRQPYDNHNGGDLVFGPDGDLYVGLGDGGSGGDPHGNGQSLGTFLGKMLRIRPTPTSPEPYRVPPDNPFVGDPGARPEIWAYGLRNPWRYSFDPATGDLWIADVGQSAWEEIDRLPAGSPGGANFGWNLLEGTHRYAGSAPPGAVPPVYEYSHAIGGDVYRGSAIPALDGDYVFADFCEGTLQALRLQPDGSVTHQPLGVSLPNVSSFGTGPDGELYVTSLDGGVYRFTRG
jgi:glucose/arabinose dehydrogenase